MQDMQFRYFYGTEADMFTFYRIPKLLVTDEYFRGITSDAKILYGLMLDRMSLSAKNGWLDEHNRVYIYFSMEDTMDLLCVGKNKALKTLAELDDVSGVGLIERRKQGQGKPTKIYVKSFVKNESCNASDIENVFRDNDSEVYNVNLKTSQNQTSSVPINKPAEVYKRDTNNIKDNNNNNQQKSNLILSIDDRKRKEPVLYKRELRDKLEIDMLIQRHPYDEELIEGILDLVLEMLLSTNESVLISRNMHDISLVKGRFQNLNSSHIEYVLNGIKSNTSKVRNIKQYILASLFNAPATISGYYQAEVNHDMPKFA